MVEGAARWYSTSLTLGPGLGYLHLPQFTSASVYLLLSLVELPLSIQKAYRRCLLYTGGLQPPSEIPILVKVLLHCHTPYPSVYRSRVKKNTQWLPRLLPTAMLHHH